MNYVVSDAKSAGNPYGMYYSGLEESHPYSAQKLYEDPDYGYVKARLALGFYLTFGKGGTKTHVTVAHESFPYAFLSSQDQILIPPSQVSRNDTSEIANVYRAYCERLWGSNTGITSFSDYWMQAGISTFFARYITEQLLGKERMMNEAEMGALDL